MIDAVAMVTAFLLPQAETIAAFQHKLAESQHQAHAHTQSSLQTLTSNIGAMLAQFAQGQLQMLDNSVASTTTQVGCCLMFCLDSQEA